MRYFVLVILGLILCNCSARKDVRYFQDLQTSDKIDIIADVVPKFQPSDRLRITVITENNVGVEPFNLSPRSYINREGAALGGEDQLFYTVDPDGFIDFPVFGKIKVEGKTKEDIKKDLKLRLEPYLRNPLVHIEMINYRVSVLGDVANPGVFPILNEKVTVLEAIALAGDLNISALRNNILVIREIDGEAHFEELDLLDTSVFSSPFFYLNQNDIVYVKPNDIKTRESSWESRIPLITSVTTFFLSLVLLFVRP